MAVKRHKTLNRGATRARAVENLQHDPKAREARLRESLESDRERALVTEAIAIGLLVGRADGLRDLAGIVQRERESSRAEYEALRARAEALEDLVDSTVRWRPRLDDGRTRKAPHVPARMSALVSRRAGPYLERVLAQAERIEYAHDALDGLIAEGREAGLSWDLIGAATGRSAEGARSRWGRRPEMA